MAPPNSGVEMTDSGRWIFGDPKPLRQVSSKLFLVGKIEVLDRLNELRPADLGKGNRGEGERLKLVPRSLDPGDGSVA